MSRDKTRIRSIIKSMKKEGFSFWDMFLKYEDIKNNKPHNIARIKTFVRKREERSK